MALCRSNAVRIQQQQQHLVCLCEADYPLDFGLPAPACLSRQILFCGLAPPVTSVLPSCLEQLGASRGPPGHTVL